MSRASFSRVGEEASLTHPWRRVVDHDGVDGVDDSVGALDVGPDHARLLLLPRHVVVLVRVW